MAMALGLTDSPHRMILRADVTTAGRTSVGYTVEVSSSRVLVRSPQVAPPGARVGLRLSFPRVLESLALDGTVVAMHDPHVHERTPGMTVELTANPSRDRLVGLLADWQRHSAQPRPMDDARVLVVDDNSLIREMFAYGVRKFFHRRKTPVTVDSAGNGEAAWQLLREGAYDLAIVDYYLPVLNGSALLARARADAELAKLPIVMVSEGGSEARVHSMQAGADLYLDKPVVLKDLLVTLEQLFAWAPPAQEPKS